MRDLHTLLIPGVILAELRGACFSQVRPAWILWLTSSTQQLLYQMRNNEVESSTMLEFHVFAYHRLLISSRIACPKVTVAGQMPFGVGTRGVPSQRCR